MMQEHLAVLLEDARLTPDELAASCSVTAEWIVEHVQAGVLLTDPDSDPSSWLFGGRDLLRARRLAGVERDFDAGPELAGLVADLLEEVERLRARLRRAGLPAD